MTQIWTKEIKDEKKNISVKFSDNHSLKDLVFATPHCKVSLQ